VTLIDPTTLERHFAQTNVSGGIRFQNVPSADVYIVHTLAKRVGHFPPMVMAFD
jgi:hypothetical protein